MLYFIRSIYAAILVWSIFNSGSSRAQGNDLRNVDITFTKTSSLAFPSAITTVDRGSRDVLVQKAKGVENVLLLKAGRKNFAQTNLTVITSDGRLHSFLVSFVNEPSTFNWKVGEQQPSIIFSDPYGIGMIHDQAVSILEQGESKISLKRRTGKVSLGLNEIYVDGKVMYYQLTLDNRSNIDYDIESMRFYVRDKMKSRRTASQEVELTPLLLLGNVDKTGVQGKTIATTVVAIKKITVPDAKRFYIELIEKDGGRHLTLTIKNRRLVRATTLPVS